MDLADIRHMSLDEILLEHLVMKAIEDIDELTTTNINGLLFYNCDDELNEERSQHDMSKKNDRVNYEL